MDALTFETGPKTFMITSPKFCLCLLSVVVSTGWAFAAITLLISNCKRASFHVQEVFAHFALGISADLQKFHAPVTDL